MDDIERNENYQSTSNLSRIGMMSIVCIAGGIFIIVLLVASKLRLIGIVIGALVCALGISALISKDQSDRKPGIIILSAGALVLLSRIGIFAPFASTLLTIGAVGLLAMGLLNGIKFLIGLKYRSRQP